METFCVDEDYFGKTKTIDLIPNGRNIDVTNQNKEYYVQRKAYYHLYQSVQQQIDAFLDGFYEIIPKELISIFTYKELELLISGQPDYRSKCSFFDSNSVCSRRSQETHPIHWLQRALGAD